METFRLVLLLAIIAWMTNCTKDNDEVLPVISEGEWFLDHMSGGLAGFDCNYEQGDVTWIFATTELRVLNNLDINAPCGAPIADDFKFSYSILDQDGKQFLLLNGNEIGRLFLLTDRMEIDQNQFSGGEGADGFYLRFRRG